MEDLLPWLYPKGISSGGFSEALAALLGTQAPGLSASTTSRLKDVWQDEMERWQRRDLTAKRYVYFWVDGIYFGARMEEEKQCILVIVGATDKRQKKLIAITDGYRESTPSWRQVLLDLKRRGLKKAPELAIGDFGPCPLWGQVLNVEFTSTVLFASPLTRPLRIEYPGAVFHLTDRGNNSTFKT